MHPKLHHRFIYQGAETGAETDVRPRRDWNDGLVAREDDASAVVAPDGSLLALDSTDPDGMTWVSPSSIAGTVKGVRRRLTHAEILTLPTSSVEIVPAPASGKMTHYMSGRVKSNISVPYTGLVAGLSWFSIRRAVEAYDESAYIVNDPSGGPDNPTFLNWLLTNSAEFLLPPGQFVVNASFQMLHGLQLGGFELQRAMMAGITNGWPSTDDLTGGDAANYIDVWVFYAEYSHVTLPEPEPT